MLKEKGYVYFIQQGGAEGPVKIGHATDPVKRLKMLQTGSPYPLALLATFGVDDMKGQERNLHQQFKHVRMAGEWFKWCEELQVCIGTAMKSCPPRKKSRFPWWKFKAYHQRRRALADF